MKSWLKLVKPLALAVGLGLAFGACDEKLDSGIACPLLCPGQQVTIRDTTFFPVVLDSSIAGFPEQGNEDRFFVASMGDTLRTVAVVRYDSLPTHFRYSAAAEDSLIYAVDSANIRLFFIAGDTLGAPTTIEIYDVDIGGPDDTDPDAAQSAFTPDRLLGSRTIPADSLRDTVAIWIDNARVLEKIQAAQAVANGTGSDGDRLRIGIRVNPAAGGTHATILSAENIGAEPILRFRPHFDPAVATMITEPMSRFPTNPITRSAMRDYLIVVLSPPDAPADVLRVGGIPGRRVYFRFDIPSFLIDSTNIIRATLELTQRPNPGAPQPRDTIVVQEFRIAASAEVTDLARALLFVQRFRDLDSLAVAAADSGLREFQMINLLRGWRGTTADRTPRTLALATVSEGESPRIIDFFSNEAPALVRPRLKIFYLPLAGGGLR